MESLAKLIQTEWENIWDYVFGRDVEPEHKADESETESATETKETS